MKVAVNTRFLLKNQLEGIGWFTYETLKRMVKNNPEVEFHFLFDRPFDSSFIFAENVVPHVLFPSARHPFLWYWWFEFSVARALKKIKPDVFLSTDGYLSLQTKVPTNVVIHDLAFEHFPQGVNKLVARYYRYFTPKFAKKAQRIATVSEFTKQDIVNRYSQPSDKIDVVYNGSNTIYKPVSEEIKQAVKAKWTKNQDYFVYVGALHPRKNVAGLLQAFDLFKQQTRSPMQLVMVGRKAWGNEEMEAVFQAMQYKNEVIFTERLASEELHGVLASAYTLVYVPFFEGFGIPLIEAQSCGVPVITSNRSSMPEVVKKSGLLVDPFSVASIAEAMQEIAQNTSLHKELIIAGNENVKRFSWEQSAEKLWQSVLKTINNIE